ncbi:MAG: helix-turn-helix transcriptional regulator [Caldilineaceae bacterium]|mgnify:FL=1|nr:helix-turn-helix transcriptional regulator [Caldilineaceae bacterium]MCB0176443.1 helix-turn-helix transcriptional regulator [Anaerolineae bacterium]MCB1825203.1 helix-turn-helix transcriptional regulator [Candidatus Competibacteraceae bacterium]MCB9125585.1 helix-turn-helix transcriptional regulator [Caldilineaceae bacterium]HRW51061.1 helix-turn-helix transcriptional regulator [Caldilinea sp.]
MYDSKVLASRVLLSRRDLDWDQKQLSEQSGVSRPYISQIERARKTNISVDVLFALADALGVTVQYLMGLTDDPLGEGSERVLREQSGDYVVFEVESGEERRVMQQLVDEYSALSPRSQRLAIEYLRMMRQVEEEEREREQRPPRIIGGEE